MAVVNAKAGPKAAAKASKPAAKPLPDAATKTDITNVLTDFKWACSFHDRIGKVSVSPYWFKGVIEFVNRSSFQVQTKAPADMAGAGASYTWYGKTPMLVVSSAHKKGDPFAESLLIHEAVHALQDYYKAGYSRPYEEACAYVGERLYYRYRYRKMAEAKASKKGAKITIPTAGDAIRVAADAIAAHFESLKDLDDRELKLGDKKLETLVEKIKAHPVYLKSTGKFKGDQ